MAWIGRSGVITCITPDIMLVLAVTTPLVMVVVALGAVVPTPLAIVVVVVVVAILEEDGPQSMAQALLF